MLSTKNFVATLSVASFAAQSFAAPAPAAAPQYSLVADVPGDNFFDAWTAYSDDDPTHGFVKYQTMQDAADQTLAAYTYDPTTESTHAYIGVDRTNHAPDGRNSVRLISKQKFDIGTLAVLDMVHAPTGPGTWGAYWFLGSGSQWPHAGEIDVFEQVHDTPHAATTLHTSPGCSVDNSSSLFQNTLKETDCNAGEAAMGCSTDAYTGAQTAQRNLATAGDAFNQQGGGVYVMSWTHSGISVWMFGRDSLPSDLAAGKPNPSSWTDKPLAVFGGQGCDFNEAFVAQNAIINITLCGDWAGKVWESSGMAEKTGADTCEDFVANNPEAFAEAYFQIASFKVYSSSSGN
ncbi:hypothetical protein KC340_g18200 [Hortaea werneckii]|nr:hypothetical protein KC342_g18442 [Hortaea werneckii]KAI7055636.1 hypothetical protein KC339_g18353 [Hortaea werneckii]KAI7204106.1 hypothetical protein KC365_g18072 [Hortaea werneckii]KAI7286577.1 hypothetical protein KC340_g18200 [Hortaea werneckii]KAI7369613.1 hypothetical protein KC328_g17927 [Hortaea werneckii]